jgi:fibronectin type 3 domain-containing protein
VPPTTAPPAPTTTVPGPETLSLHCAGAMVSGSPAVSCAWSQSTSSSFAWYRLYREVPGSNRVLIFSSDMRTKTSTGDTTVHAGTTYDYHVEVTDSAGNVIGSSAVSTVPCC